MVMKDCCFCGRKRCALTYCCLCGRLQRRDDIAVNLGQTEQAAVTDIVEHLRDQLVATLANM